jgi:pimeloyl-ACP methyl ester carboxylesterase
MRAKQPPVLMLHGQPGGARDWRAVIDALHGRADPFAIDRPGWDGRGTALDLAGNAGAALAELDARGIGRATVAGHSYGAAVAVWLAAHHPERVSALVLGAPAANLASLDPLDGLLALPVVGRISSAISMSGIGLMLGVAPARRWIARRSGLGDRYLRECGRDLLSPWAHRAFAAEQRRLRAGLEALERRLDDVRAPTWIISGSEDRVVPPSAPMMLRDQIPGAQLTILEHAGHLLPQLHARALADAIITAVHDDRRARGHATPLPSR